MPQFSYRGRNREGQLRAGIRTAPTIDQLNTELLHEGISPFDIQLATPTVNLWQMLVNWFQDDNLHREELAIFSRQMKLLHQAGVPITTAFKQLSEYARNQRLKQALMGVITYIENGQSLASAMQQYPKIFSPLMINIIRIGENTGKLSEAFEHIHHYLEFEAKNIKQIKSTFRYPAFILFSIVAATIILNIFVIPSFGRFYSHLSVSLPWQTQFLIGSSNLFLHYGLYLLTALIIISVFFIRYINTPAGKYQWDKFELHIPLFGKLLQRIILIRFSQSLAIMLSSGLPITQALLLVKDVIGNSYVTRQINEVYDAIEHGTAFTQAITKMDIFSPLELQILMVGEKNGELTPALDYVSNFHGHEIEYDLKHLSDIIGPIMLAIVSGLILIMALGIYLPIWNMVDLVHA